MGLQYIKAGLAIIGRAFDPSTLSHYKTKYNNKVYYYDYLISGKQ